MRSEASFTNLCFMCRQIALERELISMVWKLEPTEVHIISRNRATGVSRINEIIAFGITSMKMSRVFLTDLAVKLRSA